MTDIPLIRKPASASNGGELNENRDNLPTTKYQEKILASDITVSTDPVPSLGFNNLTIGRKYKVTGQVSAVVNTVSSTSFAALLVVHDGNFLCVGSIREDDAGGLIRNATFSIDSGVFEATATTVTADVNITGVSNFIAGNGTKSETWLQIEELPRHEETTDFT